MRDKHHITEEPDEVKVSRPDLETSGTGDSLAEFNGLLDETEVDSVPGAIPYPELITSEFREVYRTWKSPTDAITWASKILPDLTPQALQELFDSVPAVSGKKAAAFVEKVLSIATTF